MSFVSHHTTSAPPVLVHASDVSSVRHSIGAANACCLSPSSAICSPASMVRPLFHFTADDAVILAMEHNNHSKLLAISTSKNEVFVTSTNNLSVKGSTTLDDEQWSWDPAGATVLVDHLLYPCTQFAWAPWQHGMYLACVSRGKQVRLYRLSHGRWSLDEVLAVQECNAVSFSVFFTIACACVKGNVLIFAQTSSNENNVWSLCSTKCLDKEDDTSARLSNNRVCPIKSCTSVGWNDSGTLLAVGDESGALRIFNVSSEGQSLADTAYASGPPSLRGKALLQVLWAPGAGRSFYILAMVTSSYVTLLFFRRSRIGSNNGGGMHGAMGGQLRLCSKTGADMEEVTKLSWNANGTRFVTSHTDGAVCTWCVDVSYHQLLRSSVGGVEDSNSSSAPHYSNTFQHDDNLELVTSIRKVSVVHPYRGVNQ